MGNWNFADIWEVVADELPDATCLIHGDDRRTWSEVDRRAVSRSICSTPV